METKFKKKMFVKKMFMFIIIYMYHRFMQFEWSLSVKRFLEQSNKVVEAG